MFRYSTKELENMIKSSYSKLKSSAEKDEIYSELNILFSDKIPSMFEGEYVFSDEIGYHYVGLERGKTIMYKTTDSEYELAYWVFSHLTSKMSWEYEYLHRVENQDARRIMFKKKLELLGLIGENYRKRGEIEIDEILKKSPYKDELYR